MDGVCARWRERKRERYILLRESAMYVCNSCGRVFFFLGCFVYFFVARDDATCVWENASRVNNAELLCRGAAAPVLRDAYLYSLCRVMLA